MGKFEWRIFVFSLLRSLRQDGGMYIQRRREEGARRPSLCTILIPGFPLWMPLKVMLYYNDDTRFTNQEIQAFLKFSSLSLIHLHIVICCLLSCLSYPNLTPHTSTKFLHLSIYPLIKPSQSKNAYSNG